VSFAPDDVHSQLGGAVPVERIVAFFNLLSASAETVTGEPNPVALSPLAFAPFVRHGNLFFLFVAPLLYEGIFFALRGDMSAIAADFRQAILSPLSQAKRARDYILERDEAEFVEETTGRRMVIRRQDVSEIFLVTLVGSGAC
jgi:hypothetical protein